MTDDELRVELGMIRAQLAWTQAALFAALRVANLSREDAEGLLAAVQTIAAGVDQATADRPGDLQRAERAVQFLGALRGALGLPD